MVAAAWMRSSSLKVRLCLLRRACARKCGPMGSMAREVGWEREWWGLKSFSPDQLSGRDGKVVVTWIVAIVAVVRVGGWRLCEEKFEMREIILKYFGGLCARPH